MTKRFLTLALVLAGMFGSLAQAQIVVNVDDNTALADSYVNGVGGHYSGAAGVRNAVEAIKADTTAGITSRLIQIKDTNGVLDDYTAGTINVTTTATTIRQIPNGTGNDVPVLINTTTGNPTLQISAPDFTLEGLSPTKQIEVRNSNNGTRWVIGPNNQNNITFINVKTSHVGTGTRFVSNGGAGVWNLTDCEFNSPTYGFQSKGAALNMTFTRCTFKTTNLPLQLTGTYTLNDCVVNSTVTGGMFRVDGTTDLTFNNCALDYTGGKGPIIERGTATNILNMTVNGGTIKSFTGIIPFQFNDLAVNATFNGASAASKLDLTGAATKSPLVRMRKGKLTMNDVIIDDPIVTLRHLAGTPPAPVGEIGKNVEIVFNRSIVKGTVGTTDASTRRNVVATNSVFYNDIATTATGMIDLAGDNSVSSATLTHCTFYGPGGADTKFVNADAFTKITANFTLFDATKGVTKIATGGDFSGASSILAGVFGGNSNAVTPLNTVAPLLNADGSLQDNSNGVAMAALSNVASDINGQTRPAGTQITADIGAFEVAVVPVELSTFSVE